MDVQIPGAWVVGIPLILISAFFILRKIGIPVLKACVLVPKCILKMIWYLIVCFVYNVGYRHKTVGWITVVAAGLLGGSVLLTNTDLEKSSLGYFRLDKDHKLALEAWHDEASSINLDTINQPESEFSQLKKADFERLRALWANKVIPVAIRYEPGASEYNQLKVAEVHRLKGKQLELGILRARATQKVHHQIADLMIHRYHVLLALWTFSIFLCGVGPMSGTAHFAGPGKFHKIMRSIRQHRDSI